MMQEKRSKMAIKERRLRHRLKKKENRRLQKTIEETLCLK